MAAPTSDWLRVLKLNLSRLRYGKKKKRYFRLLLWNRGTEFNETCQETRSQRPLWSFFPGKSINKRGRTGRFVKKVTHCTQVHDMWPFWPLCFQNDPPTEMAVLISDWLTTGTSPKDPKSFTVLCFLACLHFSAEELLLYPGVRVGVHMQMLGQMLKSYNFSLSVFFHAF